MAVRLLVVVTWTAGEVYEVHGLVVLKELGTVGLIRSRWDPRAAQKIFWSPLDLE
jgi:hypothetical protein